MEKFLSARRVPRGALRGSSNAPSQPSKSVINGPDFKLTLTGKS